MMNWSQIDGTAPDAHCPPIVVNVPNQNALLEDLETRIAQGRGFTLATLNLDHVTKLRGDSAFRTAYAQHSHVTADGAPVVWATRLAGQQVSRLPGADLVEPLAERAALQGVSVALFGSTPDALADAAEALRARVPGITIAAEIAPAMGFDPDGPEAERAISEIRASGAGLCFIALGAPKQECFASRAAAVLPNVGFASIGAGLDFLSGRQRRAPRFVQALAAEWIWRLLHDPTRLAGRYLNCLTILPAVARSALRQRAELAEAS